MIFSTCIIYITQLLLIISSTLALDRQKLSFGLQTNLTQTTLFVVKMESDEEEDKFVEFSVDADGRLFAQLEAETVNIDPETTVSNNEWHRISLVKNRDEIIIGDGKIKKGLKGFHLTSTLDFGK